MFQDESLILSKVDFDSTKIKHLIEINCSYTELVHLSEIEPTQGDLKVSSIEDLEKLDNSLKEHGYIQPIVLWWNTETDTKTRKMLDGHQRRYLHLLQAKKGVGTPNFEVPVIYAKAPTYEEAMKVLLRLVSVTGELTTEGLVDFVSKNKFNLSDLTRTMSLKSPSLKKARQRMEDKHINSLQKNPEHPIQLNFGESYNGVVIFCDNDTDWMWLKNLLSLGKKKDLKSKHVGETRVVHVQELQSIIQKLKVDE